MEADGVVLGVKRILDVHTVVRVVIDAAQHQTFRKGAEEQVLAVPEQRVLQVRVNKVVIKLQHAYLGVLQNEESHVYGQGVRDGFFSISISFASSTTTSSCRNRLSLIMSDAAFTVQ